MKQTGNTLAGFVKRLMILNREVSSMYEATQYHLTMWERNEKREMSRITASGAQGRKDREKNRRNRYQDYVGNREQAIPELRQSRQGDVRKWAEARARKAEIRSTRESISFRPELEKQYPGIRKAKYAGKTFDGNVLEMAAECTRLYRAGKKKDAAKALAMLDAACDQHIRKEESTIHSLGEAYFSRLSGMKEEQECQKQQLVQKEKDAMERQWSGLGISDEEARKVSKLHLAELDNRLTGYDKMDDRLDRMIDSFLGQYPPFELRELCTRAYGEEPSWKYGTPPAEMPECAFLGMLEYPLDGLDLSDEVKNLLRKHYPFLFREDSLLLPWAPELGEITGFRFHYWKESQDQAAAYARDTVLRMCLVSPAGMTKFTLTDPEQLGESFSGLAALDPGGKLWGSLRSDPDDIERALRELAKHITDVNQRCLRGEFANLAEYNRSGTGIPEKFRVLVLMDYPMGLTERSLELLEQILRSGPKCGVLPFVFVNGSMMLKCSETRRKQALDLINDMPMLRMDAAGSAVTLDAGKIQSGSIFYHSAPLPEQKQLKQMLDARRQDD